MSAVGHLLISLFLAKGEKEIEKGEKYKKHKIRMAE